MANIFEKAEYSDLYKFLTSIGVLVIGLSVLMPWLFLQDQLAIQVMANDYDQMICVSQELTLRKLELTRLSLSIVVVLSPILFVAGVGLCCYGIRKWNVKQRGIDELDQLDLSERRAQVRPLQKSEYQAKAQEEVKSETVGSDTVEVTEQPSTASVVEQTTEPRASEALASQLIEVEALLFDRINDYNSFDYRVQRNVKLANRFEVDVLLAAYNTNKHIDKLIEIRYFQNRLRMETVISARDQLDKTRKYYNVSTRRNVQAILLLVYRSDISSEEEINRFKDTVPSHQKPALTILVLSDSEASTFDITSLFV
jgi:hypothetical protein